MSSLQLCRSFKKEKFKNLDPINHEIRIKIEVAALKVILCFLEISYKHDTSCNMQIIYKLFTNYFQ